MRSDELEFLVKIVNFVKEHPHLLSEVIAAVHQGMEAKISELKAHASEAETALSLSITNKKKFMEDIKSRVNSFRHQSFLKWDWLFKEEK